MPGVLKWKKNKLTSVGFMYFERENRKQQKNFFFGLFYNKAYNWILNISIGIIWEIFNIIIHITL